MLCCIFNQSCFFRRDVIVMVICYFFPPPKQQIRKLRRELDASQEKVATLTSQLSANVSASYFNKHWAVKTSASWFICILACQRGSGGNSAFAKPLNVNQSRHPLIPFLSLTQRFLKLLMKCFEVWVVVFFEHGSNMRLVYRELSCEAGLIMWGSNIERPSKNMQIQQNSERGERGGLWAQFGGRKCIIQSEREPWEPKAYQVSVERWAFLSLSQCWALREASDQVRGWQGLHQGLWLWSRSSTSPGTKAPHCQVTSN